MTEKTEPAETSVFVEYLLFPIQNDVIDMWQRVKCVNLEQAQYLCKQMGTRCRIIVEG